MNTDAAVVDGRVGLGVIVRDCVGDIMMAAGKRMGETIAVTEAEALAVLFGMRYAYDAGLRSVEIETDYSVLHDLLQGLTKEKSITQAIVNDARDLARSFDFCVFKFARRDCNEAAHSMAKTSLSFEEVIVWIEDCPPSVSPSVLADKEWIE